MTTADAAPRPRTSILDRTARWALDLDGDLFGDERERTRWYEGIAIAAGLQWLAAPWAATVLVWVGGRAAVLPLVTLLALTALPAALCTLYVRQRRVDTRPATWSPKRIVLTVLFAAPYPLFMIGAVGVLTDDPRSIGEGFAGLAIGAVASIAYVAVNTRLRRRRDAIRQPDVD